MQLPPFVNMKKFFLSPLGIIFAVIIACFLYIGSMYNGLVAEKATLDSVWAQVETQYQRRFDLIPNLQATVQGAADFEKETFTAVTQARSQWQQAGSQLEQVQAINNFDSALSRLLVTVESYPELNATQSFRDFMVQLEGTENRISTARRDYNEQAKEYNIYVKSFPRNLAATLFNFEPTSFFQSSVDAATAPTVNF